MTIWARQVREFLVAPAVIKELTSKTWRHLPCTSKISPVHFFRTSYSSCSSCNLKEINCIISATEEVWVDNTDNTKHYQWNLVSWGDMHSYSMIISEIIPCPYSKPRWYVPNWLIYPDFTDTKHYKFKSSIQSLNYLMILT